MGLMVLIWSVCVCVCVCVCARASCMVYEGFSLGECALYDLYTVNLSHFLSSFTCLSLSDNNSSASKHSILTITIPNTTQIALLM